VLSDFLLVDVSCHTHLHTYDAAVVLVLSGLFVLLALCGGFVALLTSAAAVVLAEVLVILVLAAAPRSPFPVLVASSRAAFRALAATL
jgi:hypothetical protein